jgi:hypothetical protein
MTKHTHVRRPLLARIGVISIAVALIGSLCGCERLKEALGNLGDMVRTRREKKTQLSDHERVLRKFGEPRERLGVGKAAHRENGISYNRKWNYYYSSRAGEKPAMRTIYFMDDRFVGSVLHQPDGSIRKEKIRFPY